MNIWIGVGALTVIVLALAMQRVSHLRAMRRCALSHKPSYEAYNQYTLADWYSACEESLAWSRWRRNKEAN